jgi:alpha-L-fucosidase
MPSRDFKSQSIDAMPTEEYVERYFTRFDPDLYDPDAWADAAVAAGMKYVVVVAKHHEGFCLWDSELTDLKSTKSPAGRDLLRPMLDAFRARGLRVGLYYSLIDWHHPDFTVDMRHPLAKGDVAALNESRDMARYREYIRSQISELLTEYGPIDIMWPDYSYDEEARRLKVGSSEQLEGFFAAMRALGVDFDALPGKGAKDWDAEELLRMIRELQPGILVNDRLGLADGWDITTPEQTVPDTWPETRGEPALWETCQTFSGSWGWNRDESTWKSTEQLIVMLIDVVSKGGNLLLNVGPTARGEFEPRVLERLAGIGEWMRYHSRSIYGCTQAPDDIAASVPGEMRATYNPTTNRLYLHLLRWPAQPVRVPGLRDRVEYAQLLHDGTELRPPTDPLSQLHGPDSGTLWLATPVVKPAVEVPVIELFLRR